MAAIYERRGYTSELAEISVGDIRRSEIYKQASEWAVHI